MQVWWVTDSGLEPHAPDDVTLLLERSGSFVWVDVPDFDDEAAQLLTEQFNAHPLVVKACRERNSRRRCTAMRTVPSPRSTG